MDQVRFGRVLGQGARQMIKTLASAAAAASAAPPAPRATVRPAGPSARAGSSQNRPPAKTRTAPPPPGVKAHARRFREAAWSPFVRLSGVLWLEVTGLFFGLIALFAVQGAWRSRAELHPNSPHIHFVLATAIALLFGYFCVTSYVRARRRERRR